ncbi:CvpA family protein [Jiella sp. MQZ9-1]|uniref:CvpA family protein n=1 Tax=Jiella flava TaxID=2816857 RepID=A0A939FSP1_9HYPH|nr:CvpA family protein [Jiella flava]MBO0661193.1 CvpA family protein [Jiella flava]MCD2469838.1 CvpA family protein [Jiella flava]
MSVTLLDAILVAIMLVSALLAMVRGFSREVLSVVSWVAAALVAFMFYSKLTPFALQYVHSKTVAMAGSAAVLFIITLIVVSYITLRIADFIIDSRIGALDRVLGFVFGAVRGLLLVVVAMLFFNWLAPQNQPTWIANAKSKPFLDDLGKRLVAALPQNPEGLIVNQIEKLKEGGETGEAQAPASDEPSTVGGAIQQDSGQQDSGQQDSGQTPPPSDGDSGSAQSPSN